MGLFFDWLEICLIVLPIFAPILRNIDFTSHIAANKDFMVWFVALVAVNLQSAFLTPPFGFALFYMKHRAAFRHDAAHLSRHHSVRDVQMLALAFCMIWPEIILWLPRHFGFLD